MNPLNKTIRNFNEVTIAFKNKSLNMRKTVNHRTKKEAKGKNKREINIAPLEKIDNIFNEDVKEFKNI